MSAPDRPTREQVDADALALIDDLFATFLIPHDDADPMHAGWTRAASVRADVAQQWRDRRAALAARTPQPAPLGEDVPARLNAAADALEAVSPAWATGADYFRMAADELRDRHMPTLDAARSAVAAALARPTGDES